MDEPDTDACRRRRDLFEVCVLLFLILPSIIGSFFASESSAASFPILAFSTVSRELALTILVLFFLWRNGEPLARIGWKFDGLKKEAALGVVLLFAVPVGDALVVKAS